MQIPAHTRKECQLFKLEPIEYDSVHVGGETAEASRAEQVRAFRRQHVKRVKFERQVFDGRLGIAFWLERLGVRKLSPRDMCRLSWPGIRIAPHFSDGCGDNSGKGEKDSWWNERK
jgi:hypothetical protein